MDEFNIITSHFISIKMYLNIFLIFAFYTTHLYGSTVHQKPPSVLVIGSSVPAISAAMTLANQNFSITLQYATPAIDNSISATTMDFGNVSYRLPKHHPAIYEHSTLTRELITKFGNSFTQMDDLYLHTADHEDIDISSNEYLITLLFSAARHGCIKVIDIIKSHKLIRAIKDYDYGKYRLLYSNITLAQFAQIMDTPPQTLSCLLKSALIDTGHQVDVINAADAIVRMHFYYFKGENGLRSYHMKNPYASKTDSKILVDQIIERLKSKNTTFISNNSIEAFWVDTDKGKVLGDINNRTIKYDYIILGDTLNRSRRILSNTQQYNTGAPNIFQPLDKILNILNQYSNPPTIISMKLRFSKNINMNGIWMLQVNNSPLPFSIQSIKQINKLSGDGNPGTILEIIIANSNGSAKINLDKVFREIVKIIPELQNADLIGILIDDIDTGVLMDTKYGANRLSTESLLQFGIPNLILAGDWLDAAGTDAFDIERSFEIGHQAALTVIKKYFST